jgi:electron transport complex protein RnfC
MSFRFYGGIHPPALKTITADRPVKRAFIPKKVVLPLSQHTGSPAEPVVSVGATVKVGDPVAKPSGHISAAVHASLSGKVTKLEYSPTRILSRVLSITIESQGDEDQEFKPARLNDAAALSREDLLAVIKEAGIVGQGGAVFPTHVKLDPPKTKPVDAVILNGTECEPCLTCDHRLMVERPVEILKGLDIIMKVLGVKKAYIAIEDNKLAAIYAMERALEKTTVQLPKTKTHRANAGGLIRQPGSIKIAVLKTKYPQGAEKQAVKAVLGRVVPAGGLPMDVGCVVQNVATAFSIYEAVYLSKPLIERVVTVTGSCIREPMNVWARIGTMLPDLIGYAGGFVKEPAKVIVGGPMMGIAQYTMDIPVTKGFNGVIFLSREEVECSQESVCIRCGKCLEVCPMGLAPSALMYRVKKELFNEAQEMGITNCYECGACAYTCPAKIPLLDYMKYGKSKVAVLSYGPGGRA